MITNEDLIIYCSLYWFTQKKMRSFPPLWVWSQFKYMFLYVSMHQKESPPAIKIVQSWWLGGVPLGHQDCTVLMVWPPILCVLMARRDSSWPWRLYPSRPGGACSQSRPNGRGRDCCMLISKKNQHLEGCGAKPAQKNGGFYSTPLMEGGGCIYQCTAPQRTDLTSLWASVWP
jgi:hypothetical protein